MGIFSEVNADYNAQKLESIILEVINHENDVNSKWENQKEIILNFIEDEIVQWYYDECADAFRKPNKKILELFPIKFRDEK